MSDEINFNSVNFNEFNPHYTTSLASSACTLHEAIFSQRETTCSKQMTLRKTDDLSPTERKTHDLFAGKHMQLLKAKGSGSVEIDISWGGSDGVEVTIGGTAEVHDERGNYVEITVEENINGTGNVNISAGHEEE